MITPHFDILDLREGKEQTKEDFRCCEQALEVRCWGFFSFFYLLQIIQQNCRLNRARHQKAQKSLKRRKGQQKQKIIIRWVESDIFFFKSDLIFKVEFQFVHIKEEISRRVSTVVESSVIMLSRGMLSSASKIEKKVSSNLNSSSMKRLTLFHNCAGQRQIECRHRRQETWKPSPSYKPGSSTTLQRWRKVSTVGMILNQGWQPFTLHLIVCRQSTDE